MSRCGVSVVESQNAFTHFKHAYFIHPQKETPMSTAVRERSDIPVEHKWNTEAIFADQAAWEDALADVRRRLETAAEYQGRLGDDPDILVAWLEFVQILFHDAQRVFMYAYLEYSVDTEDPQAAGRINQARTLVSDVQAAVAFAEPALLELDPILLAEWLETHPGLATGLLLSRPERVVVTVHDIIHYVQRHDPERQIPPG